MSTIISDLQEEYEATKNSIKKHEQEKAHIEGRLAELDDKKTMLFGLIEKWGK